MVEAAIQETNSLILDSAEKGTGETKGKERVEVDKSELKLIFDFVESLVGNDKKVAISGGTAYELLDTSGAENLKTGDIDFIATCANIDPYDILNKLKIPQYGSINEQMQILSPRLLSDDSIAGNAKNQSYKGIYTPKSKVVQFDIVLGPNGNGINMAPRKVMVEIFCGKEPGYEYSLRLPIKPDLTVETSHFSPFKLDNPDSVITTPDGISHLSSEAYLLYCLVGKPEKAATVLLSSIINDSFINLIKKLEELASFELAYDIHLLIHELCDFIEKKSRQSGKLTGKEIPTATTVGRANLHNTNPVARLTELVHSNYAVIYSLTPKEIFDLIKGHFPPSDLPFWIYNIFKSLDDVEENEAQSLMDLIRNPMLFEAYLAKIKQDREFSVEDLKQLALLLRRNASNPDLSMDAKVATSYINILLGNSNETSADDSNKAFLKQYIAIINCWLNMYHISKQKILGDYIGSRPIIRNLARIQCAERYRQITNVKDLSIIMLSFEDDNLKHLWHTLDEDLEQAKSKLIHALEGINVFLTQMETTDDNN